MKKYYPVLMLLIAVLIGGCSGCNSEMTTEERLAGIWLISNAGPLQPYFDEKPNFRNMPIKNSKILFYPDGEVRGAIEKITSDPKDPKNATSQILDAWSGQWKLASEGRILNITGPEEKRKIKRPKVGGPTLRTIQFINDMPLEFVDDRTIIITSQGVDFEFKLISRNLS